MKVVLIAEDFEYVRKVTVEILSHMGITSIEAENGSEVIKHITEDVHDIGIVILDKGMPIMSGLTAYFKIRDLKPLLPVIMVSGHIDAIDKDLPDNDHLLYLMQKPYKFNELIEIIQQFV